MAKACIFVVESDEVVRSALQFILRDDDIVAFTGHARALAGCADREPDVIVLGIDIVRGRGDDVLAGLAARAPGAKILLVADSVADPFALGCLTRGADAVLGKPITVDAVRGKVDELLGRGELPTPGLTAAATA